MAPPKVNYSLIKDLKNSKMNEISNNKLKKAAIRMINEIKEDVNKHRNEFKAYANKQLNEIRKTMQNMKEEFNKDTEILGKKSN
jgi:hypothetical protein